MKKISVVLLAVAFSLAMVAAYADHPYSSDRDDGQGYYSERRTSDGSGYRPSDRPAQEKEHPYQSRPLGSSWDYGHQLAPLFPYDPSLFGHDSLGAWGYRPVPRYGSEARWPWPPDPYRYDCDRYRGGHPYGKAYGYYRGSDFDLTGILRLGDGRSGLTIILRP